MLPTSLLGDCGQPAYIIKAELQTLNIKSEQKVGILRTSIQMGWRWGQLWFSNERIWASPSRVLISSIGQITINNLSISTVSLSNAFHHAGKGDYTEARGMGLGKSNAVLGILRNAGSILAMNFEYCKVSC